MFRISVEIFSIRFVSRLSRRVLWILYWIHSLKRSSTPTFIVLSPNSTPHSINSTICRNP